MLDFTWLKKLKVGDNVFVLKSTTGAKARYIVTKITKTMIVLNNGARYRIKDGNRVGDGIWCSTFLQQWSLEKQEKLDQELKKKRRVVLLRNYKWENCSMQQLNDICKLLEEQNNETNN